MLVLLSAWAGGPGGSAFRAAADGEEARRPAFYGNGQARAWQVSRDGVARGLLWGTLHLDYGEDTVLPAPVRARFYAATDLAVETDLDRAPGRLRAMTAALHRANADPDPAAFARLDEPIRRALADVPGTDGLVALLRGRGYDVIPCLHDVCR